MPLVASGSETIWAGVSVLKPFLRSGHKNYREEPVGHLPHSRRYASANAARYQIHLCAGPIPLCSCYLRPQAFLNLIQVWGLA